MEGNLARREEGYFAAQKGGQVVHGVLSQLIGRGNQQQHPARFAGQTGQHMKPLRIVQTADGVRARLGERLMKLPEGIHFVERRKQP